VAAAWESTGKWGGVESMPNQMVVAEDQTQVTVDHAVSPRNLAHRLRVQIFQIRHH
jgi:hypothetical protein